MIATRGVSSAPGPRFRYRRAEHAVFECLWADAGNVVTRKQLRAVACAEEADTNCLEVQICHLRRKLSPSTLVRIETRRGAGYRLACLASTGASGAAEME
jgi:DNA-binding response OmpR family regulator